MTADKEVVSTYNFNLKRQDDEESFEEFYEKIQIMAEGCNFGESKDRMLRDKIVVGINNQRVQQKLMVIEKLTLEQAVEICRAAEKAFGYSRVLTSFEQQAMHKRRLRRELVAGLEELAKYINSYECPCEREYYAHRRCYRYKPFEILTSSTNTEYRHGS